MCETGAYPLATMESGGSVKATVMSQPALPFPKKLQSSVGLTSVTLKNAKISGAPIWGCVSRRTQSRRLRDFNS